MGGAGGVYDRSSDGVKQSTSFVLGPEGRDRNGPLGTAAGARRGQYRYGPEQEYIRKCRSIAASSSGA